MVTIKDVAKMAGVSIKTVSRVINNDPYVAEETYSKVKNIIEEVGYHPNLVARGLAKRRSFLIGLVIPEITSAAFAMMIQGVEKVANDHDYRLVLCSTGSKRDREEILVETLIKSNRVDGILLISNRIDTSYFTRIKELGVPFVLVDREIEEDYIPQVYTNNREGVYRVTSHLISTGRAKVAYITPLIDTSTTLERLEGYEDAMRSHNLSYEGRIIVDRTGQRCQGYSAMLRLLDREDPPDAVIGFNDLLAIGAMQAIKERKIRIPEDIAVAGFDDIEAASLVEPALTTARQPLCDIGEKACQMLIQLINGEKLLSQKVAFNTELIVRESCGSV